MGVEVTSHGKRWYCDGKQPQCPECNSNAVVVYTQSEREKKEGCTVLKCTHCGCIWKQSRSKVEESNNTLQ